MSTKYDAVIAALREELVQAERTKATYWKVERCNRWIGQLPGGRLRWRNLLIYGFADGDVGLWEFITHLKATIAYLETCKREATTKPTAWSSIVGVFGRKPAGDHQDEPIDAEFTDVPTPSSQKKLPKPKIVK